MKLFAAIILLVSLYGTLQRAHASSLLSASIDLCGPESEIILNGSGESSSMTVTLSPHEPISVCKLRVKAPKTHAVNVHFIETTADLHRALVRNKTENHPPCVMSIILPENPRIPVWKGDPCSNDPLPEVDLLTSDFRIIWSPPSNPSFTKGRKFVLTAVGQGAVCKEPDQHTCMKIGWDPMLCVSELLVCDGVPNCPKSSTSSDEDDKLCQSHLITQSTWEQIAVEIFKKLKSPSELLNNNKWLHEKLEENLTNSTKKSVIDWRELQDIKSTNTEKTTKKPLVETKTKAPDSISQVLSKYGPWGYLMLGMLICGTVLMFCGLWECCFRKPKTQIEPPSQQTQPTTVLVLNQQQVPPPPNYDDLDQPPSYTTLFPNSNLNSLNSITTNSTTSSTTKDEEDAAAAAVVIVEATSSASDTVSAPSSMDNDNNTNDSINIQQRDSSEV